MRGRSIGVAGLLVALAACGGGAATTGPASTPAGTSGSVATAGAPSAPGSTAAAIDLDALDVCALVDNSTVESLTGETGFATDRRSDNSSSSCFWAVTRPGVPQYLEVQVFRFAQGLAGYAPTIPGATCTSQAVSGIAVEAVGGICSGAQEKVFVVGLDRGIAVQVMVNEPKGTLTPQALAATAQAIFDGLQ